MKYNNQSKITSITDVEEFAKHLYNERAVAFHPDDDFADYVNDETKKPTFTKDNVSLYNRLMDDCFEVCERENSDIYKVMAKHLPMFCEK